MKLGWVDIDFLAQLPSRFCQIPISLRRIGLTAKQSKSKPTKPSPRLHEQMGHPVVCHFRPSIALFLVNTGEI